MSTKPGTKGFYAAQKPKGPPLAAVLVGLAVAGVAFLAWIKTREPEPEFGVASVEAPVEPIRAEADTTDRPESPTPAVPTSEPATPATSSPPEWSSADELAVENAELRRQVAGLEREVTRYRDALAQAVQELNDLARRRATVRPARSQNPHRFVFPRDPLAIIVGNGDVLIEGTIHNANKEAVKGYLVLALRVAGHETTEELEMTIPGQTVEDYNLKMHYAWAAVQGKRADVTATWEGK